MLKSIEKFFKWIADHTGISWIARKISSGWKWLFSGKVNSVSQEKKSSDLSESQANETSKSISINHEFYFQDNSDQLLLVTTDKGYQFLEKECKDKVVPQEFRLYVECCNDGETERFYITGSYNSKQDMGNEKKSVLITSVKRQKEGAEFVSNKSMKYKVGLNENRKFVPIIKVSPNLFTKDNPGISSKSFSVNQAHCKTGEPVSKTDTEDFFSKARKEDKELHNVVKVENQIATDMTKKQEGTKTPSVVSSKSQDNSTVIPQGAKLEFSPELSDSLSRASLERDIMLCKTVPNSSLFQSRTENLNDCSRHKSDNTGSSLFQSRDDDGVEQPKSLLTSIQTACKNVVDSISSIGEL